MDIIITDNYKIKCIELNMYAGFSTLRENKDKEYIVKSILENIKII